jgi:DNA-binding NtrC family response regulator
MREERFREDLFYRLRRVVLTVPPLRERPEDLPLLVEHVRRQVNTRHHLAIEGVTTGTLHRMAAYRWPGNVRELEAVLEEAMILKGQGWLKPQDLALQEAAEEAVTSADSSEAVAQSACRRVRDLG